MNELQRYQQASTHTLKYAYKIGGYTLPATLIFGFWDHQSWILSTLIVALFLVLREKWYNIYNQTKGN